MIKTILKILPYLTIVILVWLTILGVMIWHFGNQDYAKRSDCIIVLGAAAYGDKPSPVFEERIKHATNLLQQGQATKIIFTGGFSGGATHAESKVAAAFAISKGIKQTSILTETQSRTTKQNLVEAKKLMEAADLKSAIIVSDPLHLKRAAMMASDLGISAVTSPTPTTRYRSWKTQREFLFREIYFYNHYMVTND